MRPYLSQVHYSMWSANASYECSWCQVWVISILISFYVIWNSSIIIIKNIKLCLLYCVWTKDSIEIKDFKIYFAGKYILPLLTNVCNGKILFLLLLFRYCSFARCYLTVPEGKVHTQEEKTTTLVSMTTI